MPQPNGDVLIAELRRAVQQAFFGYASLKPASDTAHRQDVRAMIVEDVGALELTVRGERGEVIDDVPAAIGQALDAVMTFTTEPPAEDV